MTTTEVNKTLSSLNSEIDAIHRAIEAFDIQIAGHVKLSEETAASALKISVKVEQIESEIKSLKTQAVFKTRSIPSPIDTMTPFASRPKPMTANTNGGTTGNKSPV